MQPYDLEKILQTKSTHEVSGERTGYFWNLGEFEGGTSWVGKWTGMSPWERHSRGDEFLHVIKGTVEVELITSEGKKSVFVAAGNVFVVPKNHWHRQIAVSEVVVLGATPGVTDHSDEEPDLA